MQVKRASDIRRTARAALSGNGGYWCFFAGLLLLGFLVLFAVLATAFVLLAGVGALCAMVDMSSIPDAQELLTPDGLASIPPLLWGGFTFIACVGVLAFIYVIGFTEWAKASMSIAVNRGGLVIGHAFSGWGHGFHMGWIELVRLTYLQLWTLLFVVPGVVKSFSYAMTPFVAVDHPDWSAPQCITESRRLMVGNRFRLFCLWFSFLPWFVLAVLASMFIPLVGQFSFTFLEPYVKTATAAFYEDLLTKDEDSLVLGQQA